MKFDRRLTPFASALAIGVAISALPMSAASGQEKRPNVVMLMTDDTGGTTSAPIGGGANLGHPTPNIDRIAQEGAVFTSWYGQASCTAGRASFMTGRIPIRSALSVVVAPGDENGLTKIHADDRRVLPEERLRAPISRASGISAIKPEVLPDRARLRRDEGVRRLLSGRLHLRRHVATSPTRGSRSSTPPIGTNIKRSSICTSGKARPASPPPKSPASTTTICTSSMCGRPTWPSTTSSSTPRTTKPFFMDVNFMKMHNPNNPGQAFIGKSHLGNYSDSMLELDSNIGKRHGRDPRRGA